jgi:predicted DNA-binding transcriptional regulator YafY
MTLEERTQQLWQAADQKKVCRLLMEGEPFPRIIHPYGVSQTQRNQITLVCWQTLGFTKAGGKEGYRNLALAKITSIEMLDSGFQKRTDFRPEDSQYKDWVFHI